MFQSARLKLTAWYLLIIMLVSVIFSLVIYAVINQEYSRIERIQKLRQERQQQGAILLPGDLYRGRRDIDELQIQSARVRLRAILILVNLSILGASALLGYFLAGRTLRPIKEMLDEQNRFITDASHELRTPLTSLKSEIEVNLRDKDLNIKSAKKLLESNLEEVNNLQALSDNLIRLTQNQNVNGSAEFSQVNIKSVLEEAVKKVAVLAKHKNIHIKNEAKDFVLEADKQSLIEVFVILLDNAIKYSPKGKKVTVSTEEVDGSVIISVMDQGIGINENDLPHLFDRFYRVDKSRAKVDVSGYGLGLSIAKQIIKRHGGIIKVGSKVGRGSTFSIQLPI